MSNSKTVILPKSLGDVKVTNENVNELVHILLESIEFRVKNEQLMVQKIASLQDQLTHVQLKLLSEDGAGNASAYLSTGRKLTYVQGKEVKSD